MGWPTHIVAAAGYVFDDKGNILIVKTHHRGWDATGGQIEEGELTCSNETSEVIWVPKEDVLSYITSSVLIYRFKNVLGFDGRVIYSSYLSRPEFKLLSERYI